jgi:hypothetical protein
VLPGLNAALGAWASEHNPFYSGATASLLSLLPFAGLVVILERVGRRVSGRGGLSDEARASRVKEWGCGEKGGGFRPLGDIKPDLTGASGAAGAAGWGATRRPSRRSHLTGRFA